MPEPLSSVTFGDDDIDVRSAMGLSKNKKKSRDTLLRRPARPRLLPARHSLPVR